MLAKSFAKLKVMPKHFLFIIVKIAMKESFSPTFLAYFIYIFCEKENK
jgi:hypothetical protein